jgi:hypothetical protein
MVFSYWLNYSLIQMIEITLRNTFVFRNGGDLSRFVGVKIVVGLMRVIADGLLMEHGPNNIIGRGHLGSLRDVFGVDIQSAVQRTRQVINFCIICSDRETFFPPVIDFGVFSQA